MAGFEPQGPGAASEDLLIRVSSGQGRAVTPLAAFDDALRSAGVADFNLIRLSSVIPPRSVVRPTVPQDQLVGGFGDALYCVYAAAWASQPDTEVWAGVGWSRHRDGSGAGLFAEHIGVSEADVRDQLDRTLGAMAAGRGDAFQYEGEVLSRARCDDQPVCAVVVATYRSVGWTA